LLSKRLPLRRPDAGRVDHQVLKIVVAADHRILPAEQAAAVVEAALPVTGVPPSSTHVPPFRAGSTSRRDAPSGVSNLTVRQ
jgi:hypothetical protein